LPADNADARRLGEKKKLRDVAGVQRKNRKEELT
jgi:hypothetical protein